MLIDRLLVVLGLQLQILPETARDLVVAGALLSILLNPLLFFWLDRIQASLVEPKQTVPADKQARAPPEYDIPQTTLSGHAILIGHGRVGRLIAAALHAAGLPLLVVDEQKSELADIQVKGIETLTGLAGEQALLDRVNLAGARWLILAIPNAFEAGHLIMQARAANPKIRILARAHHNDEVDHLRSLGADVIVMGEDEIARAS